MADVEKREKENFLRNAVLVVDHSKAALISLIELDLKLKGLTFEQFLNNNQHAIFHMCFTKTRCCQCVGKGNISKTYSKVLYPSQLELLYDKTRKFNSNPCTVGANDFCCSAAISSVTLDMLDMTLARCFLFNFCFDVFWNFNLQYKKQSLGDFLNAHKHTIYHLWQNSTRCCHCPLHCTLSNSTLKFPKLDLTEWQAMFHCVSPKPSCSAQAGVAPCNSICMYQASSAVSLNSLNHQIQQKLLEHCCPLRHSVDTLVKIRNERFGHVKNARLSDSEFQAIKTDLEKAIIDIAVFCNKEPEVRRDIISTLTESLDHILSEKHKELIGQFCQNLSQQKQQLHELEIQMKNTDKGLSEATSELDQLSISLVETNKRLYDVEEKTLKLEEAVETEIEIVDRKLEKTNAAVERVGGRLEKTEAAVAETHVKVEETLVDVEETKAKVDDTITRIEEIKDEVTKTKSGMDMIYCRMETSGQELKKSSTRLEQIEKDQRKMLQDPVPSNIRENIDKELTEWESECNTFIKSAASEKIFKILKTNNCVTITASSGVGKTATLRCIALMMKKAGFDVLPITDPRDVEQFYRQNRRTLFVIDDFCGRYSINHTYVEKWKTYIDKVCKIIDNGKSAKFLIACRLQVYQDELFKSLSVFQRCECNLLSKEFRLSNIEKVDIACFYLKEKAYDILNYLDTHYCFPLLCKMYNLNPTLNIVDFFQKPYTVYESEIDKICSEGHYGKYCVLALVVMFNNCVKEDWLTDDIDDIDEDTKATIERTCEACKLNRGTPRLQLFDELCSLNQMFVKREDGVFKGVHNGIFDFLSFYFCKKMLKSLIKNANSRFIRERFLFMDTDNNTNIEFVTVIPSTYRDMYLRRLILDWTKGYIEDVFCNSNMKSMNFRQVFLSLLLQQDPSKQKNLATMQDSPNGYSAMLLCCFYGDIPFIKWCIENNGDVNVCRNDNVSPVYVACQEGHTEVVEVLLHHKAVINKCTDDGVSPLYIASQNGHTEIVKTLLHNKAEINKCTDDEASPLYTASQNGHTEIIKTLLQNKADINKCTDAGVSPLYIASQNGHTEIVKILLYNKEHINKCNDVGASPIYVASQNGHKKIVTMLLHHKADINKCTVERVSPLYIAIQNGHTEIVKTLLHNKADTNKCTENDLSPLFQACYLGHTKIVKMLLDSKADINKCWKTVSPLFVACFQGHTEIVRMLVENNADVNKCITIDASLINTAREMGHTDILIYLRKNCRDINKYPYKKMSPLQIALIKNHPQIVEILQETKPS